MNSKTFMESGYGNESKDTLTICKDRFGIIWIKSSAMDGRSLRISQGKALAIAKCLMEIAK